MKWNWKCQSKQHAPTWHHKHSSNSNISFPLTAVRHLFPFIERHHGLITSIREKQVMSWSLSAQVGVGGCVLQTAKEFSSRFGETISRGELWPVRSTRPDLSKSVSDCIPMWRTFRFSKLDLARSRTTTFVMSDSQTRMYHALDRPAVPSHELLQWTASSWPWPRPAGPAGPPLSLRHNFAPS